MTTQRLVTGLCVAVCFSLIGSSLQQKADLRLEVEPRYTQVTRETPVTLTCTLRDGGGGKEPLAACGFRVYESEAAWAIDTGSANINHTILGRPVSGIITNPGDEAGSCSLKIEGLPGGAHLLGCRVRQASGGAWRYAAMMVDVHGYAPWQYRLQPAGVLVSLPGSDVTITGEAEGQVDWCYFFLPPDNIEISLHTWRSSEKNTTRYRAWIEGRRCAVTLRNIQPSHSGFVYSWVWRLSPYRVSTDFMELIVATPPESPPLLTLNSEQMQEAGAMLYATCVVKNSRPVANITWLLGGDVIRADNRNEAPAEDAWRWNYEPQTILQRLSRRLTNDDHGKILTCQAGHIVLPTALQNSNNVTLLLRVKGPCSPSPCGPHSQCSVHDSVATCSCQPPYIGQPPYCRPECSISSHCSQDKACVNQICQDPCLGKGCGQDAVCKVVSHVPTCQCPVNFRGDPKILCEPKNSCSSNPCGEGNVCLVVGSVVACSCQTSHVGRWPHCLPECVGEADCPADKDCVNNICEKPCSGDCGQKEPPTQ